MPHYVSGTFPPSLKRRLASCPETGSGTRAVHRYILELANHLRHYAEIEEARELLHEATRNCGRPVSADEINQALHKAYGTTSATSEQERLPRYSPDVNLIEQIVAERIGSRSKLAELEESSPVPIPQTGDQAMRILFPESSLICVGVRPEYPRTRPIEHLNNLERFCFVVPSPMSAQFTIDNEGRKHERTNANTGPRRFIVCDFDIKPANRNGNPSIYSELIKRWEAHQVTIQDACAALIEYLAEHGPLVMVVFSGNLSLQAWFYCQGEDESPHSAFRAFFESAVILGADPAGWTKSQFFRMPGGTRRNIRRRQTIHFFDPEKIL
jgi:hypothetical protein